MAVSYHWSSSASSVMYQRGKKVVRANSGNTTRSQPCSAPRRSRSSNRSTTSLREWSRWMGPSWAAPTVTRRVIAPPEDGAPAGPDGQAADRGHAGDAEQRLQQRVGAGGEVDGVGVLGRVVAHAAD